MGRRRTVITGMGVVAPGAIGVKGFAELMAQGRSASRFITLFDATGFRCQVAAECDFDPAAQGLSPQEIRRLDRSAQMAIVAAREAKADAGLSTQLERPDRMAVSVGNAVGNTMKMEQEYVILSDGGRLWLADWSYAVPHSYDFMIPSSIVREVAWEFGAEGPATVVSAGCTSGLDSVGYATRLIEDGVADIVITGATDAPIAAITVACFDALKATTPNRDDPAGACRPFDRDRDGIVLGEGAAILVLEERSHAIRRAARIRGEILGYANRANAYHMTGLKPDGRELAEAITMALTDAWCVPDDIDYVNAHGSGTKQNDRHETAALKASLGETAYHVPVSSIKSMIGHSLGAIGSIELVACVLAIEESMIPPTANLHNRDPLCDLDYVPNHARDQRVDKVLSIGSGFGGFQTAVVLGRAS
jgi:minimal PKS ketosynthase (KS/KS alpha)